MNNHEYKKRRLKISREVLSEISESSSMQNQAKILSEGDFTFSRCFVKWCCLPGLILPGLLPKMDFLLFLSFPLLEPDAFRVDRPVPIK